jgi:hypothetical protein
VVSLAGAEQYYDDVVPESQPDVDEEFFDDIGPESEEDVAEEAMMEVEDEMLATTEKAPKGVKHFHKACYGGCKKKLGCGCAYCGPKGICCKKGEKKNGCNGTIGGHGHHQCVAAPKGVCSKKKKPKKHIKRNPFTGKRLHKKKRPIKIKVSMTAKNSAAYKTMVSFLARIMEDGATAKGSKGLYECRNPAKRRVVYYEDWESHHDAKVFKKAMKPNIETLSKTVIKGYYAHAIKVVRIPSKAYYCRVWAPKTKGHSKRVEKNAAVLKAFSQLVADKVEDSKTLSKGPIGRLIIKMAKHSKVKPAVQYAYAITHLKARFSGGVTKYIIDNIAKAMAGKNGLIVIGHVFGKVGNWAHLSDKAMGLSGKSFQLASQLTAGPGEFTNTLAKIDGTAVGLGLARYRKKAAQMTVKDYHVLFTGKCKGFRCHKKSESKCKASKYCRWYDGWDGD